MDHLLWVDFSLSSWDVDFGACHVWDDNSGPYLAGVPHGFILRGDVMLLGI